MPNTGALAPSERWFGAQEAARFLGVHRSTLHMAVRQGLIAPDGRTPGGHMRFREETLLAFREQLAEGAATSGGGVFAPMHALAGIASLLAQGADIEHISSAAIVGIRSALPSVDMAFVAVRAGVPRDPLQLHVVACEGFPQWVFSDYARLHKTFKFSTAIALRTGEMEVCEDTTTELIHTGTARMCQLLRVNSYAVVPVGRTEVRGVLVCACRRPRVFSEHDRAFLRGIADELATAIAVAGRSERLAANLDASRALIADAFARRARCDAGLDEQAQADGRVTSGLRQAFLRLSGAADVCTLGFGADLPTEDTRLRRLASAARGAEWPVREQWREEGIVRNGLGVGLPLAGDERAGVAVVWRGERPWPDADAAVLVSFAGAYALAVGLQ
jgi:excisionase family DNA binding protein